MRCLKCQHQISLSRALELGQFAWPEMQTFWLQCPACGAGNHLRVANGAAEQIEIVGAPGPEWRVLSSEDDPSLEYRIDPSFFHVWHRGQHYEYPIR